MHQRRWPRRSMFLLSESFIQRSTAELRFPPPMARLEREQPVWAFLKKSSGTPAGRLGLWLRLPMTESSTAACWDSSLYFPLSLTSW